MCDKTMYRTTLFLTLQIHPFSETQAKQFMANECNCIDPSLSNSGNQMSAIVIEKTHG